PMSPRQPPTATPHLLVRLSRNSDMSVGDQSRSQLAGRRRSFFQLLCTRSHATPVPPPKQLMFPDGLLKRKVRAARDEGAPQACVPTAPARPSASRAAQNGAAIEDRRVTPTTLNTRWRRRYPPPERRSSVDRAATTCACRAALGLVRS